MKRTVTGILVGGGTAATLDLVYAVLRQWGRGRDPVWTLQSVASGWLGEVAFSSGTAGAILGLVSHYGIVFAAAAAYLAVSRRVIALRSHPVACGALFGVLVFLFMSFVVLPLSAFPFDLRYTALSLLEGFASHAVFVGMPIALATRR